MWLIYRFYLKKKEKIEVEQKGEVVQGATIRVGKIPLILMVGILVALIMIVINAIG